MIKKTCDIMYLQMECIDRVACFQVSAWSAQHPSHQAQSQPPPYHMTSMVSLRCATSRNLSFAMA